MQTKSFLVLLVIAGLVGGCSGSEPVAVEQSVAEIDLPSAADRPATPWVFRSVLDKKARMVTIALNKELYVAYDATDCSLHKYWKGDVDFRGAVYTTEHGPQPTSRGAAYAVANDESPWKSIGGDELTARFLGYEISGDQVHLKCRLAFPDGTSAIVVETPEVDVDDGQVAFVRRLELESSNADGVRLRFGVSSAIPSGGFETDAEVLVSESLWQRADGKQVADYSGAVRILPTKPTHLRTRIEPFSDEYLASVSEYDVQAEAESGDQQEDLPPENVIAMHSVAIAPVIDGNKDAIWDAFQTHHVTNTVAGDVVDDADLSAQFRVAYDSYNLFVFAEIVDDVDVQDSEMPFRDDALELYIDGGNEKSEVYDANDQQLIFSRDGEGFWASNLAINHPGAEFATVQTPTGYNVEVKLPWANLGVDIFSSKLIGFDVYVDDDDDGNGVDGVLAWNSVSASNWTDPRVFATLDLKGNKETGNQPVPSVREPGLAARLYNIGRPIGKLWPLVPGQTPNASWVLPTVDLVSTDDYQGFEENIVIDITGFISIGEEGEYEFNLVSDDGGKLWIDSETIIDHDGLHGPTGRQNTVELSSGDHSIRVYHFQASGGKALRLEWRRAGDVDFSVVPTDVLSTQAAEVRVTAPGLKRLLTPDIAGHPGDMQPLVDVHPAFDLATVRPDGFRPRVGGMDWLSDGRLVICLWEPEGGVYLLDGVEGDDRSAITVRKIASGLAEPLGLKVIDDRIFVLQKQELTELIDHDGDEIVDEYRSVANGWGVTDNFHEFAFGLVYKDEHFYATLATAIDPGGASTQPQNPDRGKVVKISLDGTYEFIAHGLRTPNGIGIGVDGEIFVSDNQGDWLPSSKIVHVQEGAWYGSRSVDYEGTENLQETPPVVWLPQGEIGNSPSQPGLLNEGPYAGQMMHAEVTHGGLKRVFVEKVAGQYQGAVFRFVQGLEAGINRLTRGPDNAIYVGGVGSTGNWGQTGKLTHGLQRLRYNGASVFEMLSVKAKQNGLLVTFTEPLAPGSGELVDDYDVHRWRYVPTDEYGGPKVDLTQLPITSVTISDDRTTAFLEVDGMLDRHVVYLRIVGPVRNARGERLWSTESWYTMNNVPEEKGDVSQVTSVQNNGLSDQELADGWRLLFNGNDLANWRGYKMDSMPSAWGIEPEGTLHFNPGAGDGGSIITRQEFQNFELRLDWKIQEGGNSGIFFRASEDGEEVYHTGPEMQILDNANHPDGLDKKTSAGANYGLHPVETEVVRPFGKWNSVRIVVDGNYVQHWLNGFQVVAYELESDEWNELVRQSTFADFPGYGLNPSGHIGLQDHGNKVWFRNIKIRELK